MDSLLVERHGAVLALTLNRPRALNALDAATVTALGDAIAQAASDESVRVVTLTGAGDRAFAAGADINEIAALGPEAARRFAERGQAVFRALETLGKPSIAAVNGYALGGGCELAMACTIRIAADHAEFGQPEIDLGLLPGFGGTQRLARLVGRGRALELLLTGARIGAAEAERIGLVTRVVPRDALAAVTRALAERLAAKAPLAMRYILQAVHEGADLPLTAALQLEAALFGVVAGTDDMREGTRAFLEKRRPEFTGH
ncbi:MAG TPA: enoyl-CoA hydratase-related protein [Vicinamibacterales bacterium]